MNSETDRLSPAIKSFLTRTLSFLHSREEADEILARELADKLERDAELERRRLMRKSEQIARSLQQEQMQKSVANELPIPPRNVNHRVKAGGGAASRSMLPDPPPEPIPPPILTPSSAAAKALELNYACLDLPQHQRVAGQARDPSSAALYDTIFNVIEDPAARRNLLMKHTPEKAVPYNVSVHGGDQIDIDEPPPPLPPAHGGAKQKQLPPRPRYSDELAIDVDLQNRNYQKLSPAKFDLLMGNEPTAAASERVAGQGGRGSSFDSAEDAGAEMESLKILGLPAEELKEMGRRARQERIDEELARKLQDQLAHDDMSQEEKDRIVALEAQDKELARMLQEREKAKAKRAKERAKQKKLQREQEARMQAEDSHLLSDSYANPMDLVDQQEAEGAAGEGTG